MRLSAAAISGRRSSSSEGRPAGTGGGGAVSGRAARLNSAGGLPIRTGTAAVRPIVGSFVSGRDGAPGEGGKGSGPGVTDEGASLCVLGLIWLQVLVGDITLVFQGLQLGALKQFPPVSSEILVVRLSRL